MKKFNILFIYIQEHRLPHHEANQTLSKDFPHFNFLTTSSDMLREPEDMILEPGPSWHGTAIGWPKEVDAKVTKIPIVSN